MDHLMQAEIHRILVDTLKALGVPDPRLSYADMTILVSDRQIVGRRFHCQGIWADWLAESNTVEFYDEAGTSLRTVFLGRDTTASRKIA